MFRNHDIVSFLGDQIVERWRARVLEYWDWHSDAHSLDRSAFKDRGFWVFGRVSQFWMLLDDRVTVLHLCLREKRVLDKSRGPGGGGAGVGAPAGLGGAFAPPLGSPCAAPLLVCCCALGLKAAFLMKSRR